MRLPRARNQELVGHRVAVKANQPILFHKLVNGRSEFILIGAALGLNGVSHGRLRELNQIDDDLGALLPQHVARERVAQLGHRAQVAGVQLSHFNSFAPLHYGKMRQPLLRAARVILHRGIVLDHAADHLEESDASRERIGHGLEHHHRRRFIVRHLAQHRGHIAVIARILTR